MTQEESHKPQAQPTGCVFFLSRKKRYCSWPVKAGHDYCGNHLWQATGTGEARVPCPANPNHDVPVSQLAAHLPKCPDALHQAALRAQPYFQENINAGADDKYGLEQLLQQKASQASASQEAAATAAVVATASSASTADESAATAAAAAAAAAGLMPTGPEAAAVAAVAAEAVYPFLKGAAADRQAAAVALGPAGFAALLDKIDTAHAVLTAAHPLSSHQPYCADDAARLKEQCMAWDRLMTFDAKHALQNAAIVGNMSAAGLLQQAQQAVFMELGAGKAWLTAWLHMLTPGSNEFVLLDKVGCFHNKADRRLRHTNVTRVAIDLKDAALLPLLEMQRAPPAGLRTDGSSGGNGSSGSGNGNTSSSSKSCLTTINYRGLVRVPDRARTAAAAAEVDPNSTRESCLAATAAPAAADSCHASSTQQQQAEQQIAAVAEQPPPAPSLLPPPHPDYQQQQQQQSLPWVVLGKHLCGAATDFALRSCFTTLSAQQEAMQGQQQQQGTTGQDEAAAAGTQQQQQQQQHCAYVLQGLAIASCCHHRCGWMSYTGREALQAAGGVTKEDFDIIAWLTGWALCGHQAAPGAGQAAAAADDDGADGGGGGGSVKVDAAASSTTNTATCNPTSTAQQKSRCSPAGDVAAAGRHAGVQQRKQKQQQQQQQERGGGAWHPADTLTHQQRIQLGLKCKQLIDAGRCAWLQDCLAPLMHHTRQQQQQQQLPRASGSVDGAAASSDHSAIRVQRVAYIDESITGENTLLLLGC